MVSWDQPLWLWALVLLLPMGWSLAQMLWRLRSRKERYAESDLLAEMRVRVPEREEALRLGLLIASFACLLVAAAGPRVGGKLGTRLPGEVPILVVALDVSKSMGVSDVSPSRMEAARTGVGILLDNLPGWRVGLVAFADEAMVLCPMTSDVSAVKTLAARLKPGHAELRQGSNLEQALQVAQGQLRGRPGAILVASDGEELAGELKKVLPQLQKSGTVAYAFGVGSSAGGRIPDGQDLFGEPTYRLDRMGTPVLSKANLRALETLAKETGGVYADGGAPGAAEDLLAALRARWGEEAIAETGRSLYQWPLVIGLLLWLASVLLEYRARLSFGSHLSAAKLWRRLSRQAGLILALAALSQTAWTWPWAGMQEVQKAGKAYTAGKYDEAGRTLEAAIKANPGDSRLHYDLGCARYQAGDFAGASKAFGQALEKLPKGSKNEGWIRYNLGNAEYRLGESRNDRRKHWQKAVENYQAAVKLDSQDADARYNLDLVQKRLKELPPQKPQGGGAQQQEKPQPAPGGESLPNEAEIQATLDALQHEERKLQEAVKPPETVEPPTTASDLFKQLMNQSTKPNAFSDRPDW